MISVLVYMLISSSMIVVNKAAVTNSAAPITTVFLQNLTTFMAMCILRRTYKFSAAKARAWGDVVIVWFIPLVLSTKALQTLRVEMMIVLRACTTVGVALIEWRTLGTGQVMSLTLCVVGCFYYGYLHVSRSAVHGVGWGVLYAVFMVINNVYTKRAISSNRGLELSEIVLYNNLLSLPLLAGLAAPTETLNTDFSKLWAMGLSCVLAIGISYVGTRCRAELSATAFVMMGNACKIVSVLINKWWFSQIVTAPDVTALTLTIGGCCMFSLASE